MAGRPYDGSGSFPGLDAWKTRAPAMGSARGPLEAHLCGPEGHAYRCLDCAWTGTGAAAYDHHRDSRHHRIVNRGGVLQRFGCCDELAAPLADEASTAGAAR
jgi:hypothetical protein